MRDTSLSNSANVVYPGTYIPLADEKLMKLQRYSHLTPLPAPPVHLSDEGDMFMLEIPISGIKREELCIETDEDDLHVRVLHHRDTQGDTGSNVTYDYMEQHVQLPNTADTSFVSAEYLAGKLRLHLPKAKTPQKNGHSTIIVY